MATEPSAARKTPFLQEAVAAQRDAFQGEPLMAYPISLRRLSPALAIAALIVMAALAATPYTDHIQARATLRPTNGYAVLAAGQSGSLTLASEVVPGAVLHKDALIGRIDASPSVKATTSLSDASLSQLVDKGEGLRAADRLAKSATKERLETIDRQLLLIAKQGQQLTLQRELMRSKLDLKQAELTRQESLARNGFVSEQYLSGIRSDLLALKAGLAEVDQKDAALSQSVAALRQQRVEIDAESAIGDQRTRQDLAELNSRITAASANRSVQLRASADLQVLAVHVESGTYVSDETPVISISNANASQDIVSLVDARALASLRVGMMVRVRYDAYPYTYYGTFGGRVVSIDTSPWLGTAPGISRHDPAMAAARADRPVYRVVIRPDKPYVESDSRRLPLATGMTAFVEIPHTTRSLLMWLVMPAQRLTE